MITLAIERFQICDSTGVPRLKLNSLRSALCSLCSNQVVMRAKIKLDEAVSMKCDNRMEGGITPDWLCGGIINCMLSQYSILLLSCIPLHAVLN